VLARTVSVRSNFIDGLVVSGLAHMICFRSLSPKVATVERCMVMSTLPRRHSRLLPRLAAIALSLVLVPAVAGAAHAGTTAPSVPASSPAARTIVAAMQPGWGMGNTYDAIGADETAWGNPPVTQALLKKVRSQGFKSVRIPVTWEGRQGGAPDYPIDAAWLAKVRQTVSWALADGLYVMINLHHDSWMWINTLATDHDAVLARFTATWTQLAMTFRNVSDRLVFESDNEPTFSGTTGDDQNYQLLDELNSVFHRTVRGTGGGNATRLLVLPTLYTNADQPRLDALAASLAALNDPMVATTIHFYGWWPFSVNIAGFTRFDATAQQDLEGTFDRVYNTFVAHGVPVIMGEYALFGIDPNFPGIIERGEIRKFFEYLGYYARLRKVTTIIWDAGQFLNRGTLQWRDPELFAQIKSSWATRSGTASTDMVFTAKSSPITGQTVTLNPNGTDFQGLRQGSRNLVKGKDYMVSGDQLTLPAETLTRLVGDRAYGVDATLEARFSRGVPWRIDVITYDTAALSDATGTTSGCADSGWSRCFAIPTDFRGDVLATAEARYDDGSNAGPASWTSFQQYGNAFWADYPNGAINLTPEFFKSINDGARVTLTFHFWSGATVTYHVTRSGTSVTGTTA
jgi:endoglucanase